MMPGCGWVSSPAGGLLASVVASAGGGQVALAGDPGGVGEGVVEVAVHGLGAAAGCGALRGAGPDQVPEFPAGGVAVFLAGMVAGLVGDGGERDVQFPQEVRERRGLPLVRAVPGSAAVWRRDPGVLAAGAAVCDRGAVGSEEGEAPAGAGMGGGGLQQAAGVAGVGQSPAAGPAGGG